MIQANLYGVGVNGNVTIAYAEYEIKVKCSENSINYKFNKEIFEDLKKEIWSLYQAYINQKSGETIENMGNRMQKVKKIIKKHCFYHGMQIESGSLDAKHEKYLKTAETLHGVLQEVILSQVRKAHKLKIEENCLKKDLDKAERYLHKTFEDLFDYYLEKEQWQKAYQAAKSICCSRQGTQALFKLAKIQLIQSKNQEMTCILDTINIYPLHKQDIIHFLQDITSETSIANLISSLRDMSNDPVKRKITGEFIEKLYREGKKDIASELMQSILT